MKTSFVKIVVLGIALCPGIVSAQSWLSPTAVPPGNNAFAPLNVSGSHQVKSGGISVASISVTGNAIINGLTIGSGNSEGLYQDDANGAYRARAGAGDRGFFFQTNGGSATSLFVGLAGTYSGNVGIGTVAPTDRLEVDGRIVATGDVCVKMESGEEKCLSELSDTDTTLSCPSTPNIDTTIGGPVAKTPNSGGWVEYELPASCMTEEGCLVIRELYNSNGLYRRYKADFQQMSESPYNWYSSWTSSTRNSKYRNGDINSNNIITAVDGMEIRDDANGIGETFWNKISYRDNRTGYGMKVFFCGYSSE